MRILKEKLPGRNNHNALKLIEKYNDLKFSERLLAEIKYYLKVTSACDHFTRVLNEQENYRKQKFEESKLWYRNY